MVTTETILIETYNIYHRYSSVGNTNVIIVLVKRSTLCVKFKINKILKLNILYSIKNNFGLNRYVIIFKIKYYNSDFKVDFIYKMNKVRNDITGLSLPVSKFFIV